MDIHVVQSGENLYTIAESYGVSAERLSLNNEIPIGTPLVVGQTLVILYPETVHTVQPGDTVASIAESYGVLENQIYRNNINLGGQSELYVGQSIVISYSDDPQYTISSNGYAYPFIDLRLLNQTLPYNTYLTPFTYGITAEGGLVDLNDEMLLRAAGNYQTIPLMHLSTLTTEGEFDSELADIVLNSPEARENLIENIISTMDEKGYMGLDVDFEYVPSRNKEKYAEFVSELKGLLNPLGKIVIVALAPKTSSTQPGLLYEGHDYELLGNAADFVLLMTYEWGYTYGPPMAVAPIPSVRRVLDYAVTVIPREKIFMGIPNYGYDWPLPYVQGETRAQSISNVRAVEIARRAGVQIMFDEVSKSPHFNYTAADGVLHEVWFEDARSMDAKFDLIREYSFYGAGYWNLMRPFPQNWLLLNARFNLRR